MNAPGKNIGGAVRIMKEVFGLIPAVSSVEIWAANGNELYTKDVLCDAEV